MWVLVAVIAGFACKLLYASLPLPSQYGQQLRFFISVIFGSHWRHNIGKCSIGDAVILLMTANNDVFVLNNVWVRVKDAVLTPTVQSATVNQPGNAVQRSSAHYNTVILAYIRYSLTYLLTCCIYIYAFIGHKQAKTDTERKFNQKDNISIAICQSVGTTDRLTVLKGRRASLKGKWCQGKPQTVNEWHQWVDGEEKSTYKWGRCQRRETFGDAAQENGYQSLRTVKQGD